jgi:hypothetical protein
VDVDGTDAGNGATPSDAGTSDGSRYFGSGTMCKGPGLNAPPAPVAFAHLSATVLDLDGNPVSDVPAQACGVNICLNGTTSTDGSVVIDQTANIDVPAFKYGGGKYYAKFALPLGTKGPIDVDLGDETTVAFDAPEHGVPIVPGTEATSNGITLAPPTGATVNVDPLDYDTPALQNFRAVEIPVDKAPTAVDPQFGFGIVVALTPVAATICPAAKLRVPNTAKYPAGSRVQFFVHGTEVDEEWSRYGGFGMVSEGSVSADGATVETDDAGGIPILSVVGVRPATQK